MYKVFVLNLERDTTKKSHIKKHFKQKNISFEFVNGIDGQKIPEEQINEISDLNFARKNMGRDISLGEIGCALGHNKIYERILSDNLDGAFIFEDDVILHNDINLIMDGIYNQKESIEDNSVVYLGDSYIKLYSKKVMINEHVGVYDTYLSHCLYAYYIDRKAAETLLKTNGVVKYTADSQALMKHVNKLSLNVSCVTSIEDILPSSINLTRDALTKKSFYKRWFRKIRDNIFRKRLAFLMLFIGVKRIIVKIKDFKY